MGAKKRSLTPWVCEMPGCGYDLIVQRHRIIPGKEGGKYTAGNVIALCPNHHGEADRGWIERVDLLRIVEARLAIPEASVEARKTFAKLDESDTEPDA